MLIHSIYTGNQQLFNIISTSSLDAEMFVSLRKKGILFAHTPYSEDNTIKFLYKLAKYVTVQETQQYKSNFQHTLQVVLSSNGKLLERIKKSLKDVPDTTNAVKLIEKRLTYNASVKKHLLDISKDSESIYQKI